MCLLGPLPKELQQAKILPLFVLKSNIFTVCLSVCVCVCVYVVLYFSLESMADSWRRNQQVVDVCH